MRILTPEEAKKGSTRAEDDLRARARDLSLEEERLVKSVNDLRADEENEKSRIESEMATFRAEAKNERDRLSSEVRGLESRREAAMRPIEAVSAEAERRNGESAEREAAVAKAEDDLSVLKSEFEERRGESLAAIYDRRQIQDEREKELGEREEHLRQEEALSRESLDSLNRKWADFNGIVARTDAELIARENIVSAREAAENVRVAENDRRNLELNAKETQITDKYATLERAVKHFEERKKTP